MRKTLFLTFVVTLLLTTSVFAATGPSVAVLDFRNTSSAYWWKPGLGTELAGLLSNELTATKKFNVVERQKIGAAINELKFGESGLVDPSTKRKLGKIKAAHYLITATITSFEENTSEDGGAISFMGFSVGRKEARASLSIDLRVINTETGEIADSRSIEATSETSANAISGSFMGIGGSTGNAQKVPVTKAVRGAVILISEYLECSMVEKTPECIAKYDAADAKRRAKTRESIKLDE